MLLSEDNKRELVKRSKSLAWRAGGQLAALLLAFAAENLQLFNLPPLAIVVLGLVIGELTKVVSNARLGRIGK
mgnify:CR=1 FL=1